MHGQTYVVMHDFNYKLFWYYGPGQYGSGQYGWSVWVSPVSMGGPYGQ